MPGKLLNLGFGNSVVARRVLAIVNPSSAPMKRLREEAREAGHLIDATQGRRTRSIIVLDSGHVVLSAIQADTMSQRFEHTSYEDQSISIAPEGEVEE
ncbi:hypothetical protein AAU61_18315 [Desulfocarbo indianensis]|nr:hypothetical protein AAU61_18315 [Desulfocarbo indianensis]